jgi:hypothetical protein
MSEIKIKRRTRTISLTLGTATADATSLRLDDMAGGVISVGTMATAASTLQLFGSVAEDGPYRRVYGADGSAADITLAPSTSVGQVYSLPDAVYALPFVRIVSGSTAATAIAAVVNLKS